MATMSPMTIDVAKLAIVHYPDPILRKKAEPIADPRDPLVREVATRMLELMQEAHGIGLAAPQVGLPWRMFVIRHKIEDEDHPDQIFINPVFSNISIKSTLHEEGCLSLPEMRVDVQRPISLTVTAENPEGERFELEGHDLIARVWQHEMDHLDGVLILDRMSPMDRLANRRILRDLEAEYQASRR